MRQWLPLALLLAVCAAYVPHEATQLPTIAAHRPSQGQAAWQFLTAVLRADYTAAYRRLAPEVRQAVTLGRFEAAARPLWKAGQQRKPQIELYKLGVRLGDGRASRLFYTFSFAADSSIKPPPVVLEVTFRDTASRAILGFGVRTASLPSKVAKPVSSKPKQ